MDYITEEDYKREIRQLKIKLDAEEASNKSMLRTITVVICLNLITITAQIVSIWLRLNK